MLTFLKVELKLKEMSTTFFGNKFLIGVHNKEAEGAYAPSHRNFPFTGEEKKGKNERKNICPFLKKSLSCFWMGHFNIFLHVKAITIFMILFCN